MATKIRGRQIETDDFIKSVRNSDLDWTNDVNTASKKAIAQYVASAAGGVLVCTFNGSTMDKTPQEIYEAYQDGKFVVCVAGNIVYSIEEVFFQSSAYIIKFASVINSNGIPEIGYIMYNGSSWSTGLSVMQKQLVSGTNIKTINGNSLLGSGNITIDSDIFSCTFTLTSGITGTIDKTASEILQASNSNKSVLCIYGNEIYFLVSKNVLTFSRIIGNACKYISYNQSDDNWMVITTNLQTSLVSGTSIKTINNESILGSGNIDTKEMLICTFTGTTTITCDKTVAQMYEAWQSNKIVVGFYSAAYYFLQFVNNAGWAVFFSIRSYDGVTIDKIQSTDGGTTWTKSSIMTQEKLTSGTTIKTINNQSILGSGNITIQGGGGGGDVNVIEVVKVNGTALTPDSDKAVNINDIPWSIVSSKPTIPDVSGKADKVSGASNGNLAGLNSSGNITDSSIASSDVTDAIGKRHTHSNKTMLDNIPSSLGSSGQALCVNSAGTGLEFKTVSGGGGLSDYDFTHTIASGVSGTVTVTFAANTRGTRMMTATADIGLAVVCNNSADNYIWVMNNGSSDIDVTINSVTYNNSSMSASNIFIPEDGITIPKGNVAEIGIVCNADGAFITVRADLKANS